MWFDARLRIYEPVLCSVGKISWILMTWIALTFHQISCNSSTWNTHLFKGWFWAHPPDVITDGVTCSSEGRLTAEITSCPVLRNVYAILRYCLLHSYPLASSQRLLSIMTNKLGRKHYKVVVLFVFQRIWGVILTAVFLSIVPQAA